MKRLQVFWMMVGFVGLALWVTGCECPRSASRRIPKQQATNTAKTSADKAAQCAQQLQQAEQQIQDLTNELGVTYLELEQEQTKTDVLLDENQNLNEQVQALTKRLQATESKSSEPEKVPNTP